MKKVLASMSGFVAAAFGIAILGLLMSLTYGALQRIFPDSFINQIWGLILFDIAAMAWALTFVFQSKSTGQYAAAGIGFIVGFLGTLVMVAAEVILSGQDLAQINTGEIGRWMVYTFIIATALHAALVYAHHAMSPEISEQINVGVARGEVVTQAITDATKTIEAEKHDLSRAIYFDIVSQVKRDLGLYPVDDTVFDRRNTRQFNLETEDMPIEEWAQLEADLRDKGYLKSSNLPKVTRETAPGDNRPWSQRLRDWVSNLKQQPGTAKQEPSYHPGPLQPQRPQDGNPYWKCHGCDHFTRTDLDKCSYCGSKRGTFKLDDQGRVYMGEPKPQEDAPAKDDPFPEPKE